MTIQISFADKEYPARCTPTRKEKFLTDLDRLVPWSTLIALIEPRDYRGERVRPLVRLETMLRAYLCQKGLGLWGEGIEDAIANSIAARRFVGVDLIERQPPDATTLLKFRRLLEDCDMPVRIFALIREHLRQQGLILHEGFIVDTTLITAPPTTNSNDHERDAEMHEVKKANHLYFGVKAHIGEDMQTRLARTLVTTAADESDVRQTHKQLNGDESHVQGDAGYHGAHKRGELKRCAVGFVIVRGRSTYKKLDEADPLREFLEKAEHANASVRSTIKHMFHMVKNLFRHRRYRHKGRATNAALPPVLFQMANLMLSQRTLCVQYKTVAS